jgi:Baseplate J-like protein
MHESLEEEVLRIAAHIDGEQNEQGPESPGNEAAGPLAGETIHIHYYPDVIVIVKEDDDDTQQGNAIETTLSPQQTSTMQEPVDPHAIAVCLFGILLVLSCIAFQVSVILNPPTVTVTIIPKTKTITLSGTLRLGRLVAPLTISQAQTFHTTGMGHQEAQEATGSITFYNGLFTRQIVSAGTILTGASGVHIATDQDVTLPAGNPPTYGQSTVSAHAITPGGGGNIPAYDINQVCCANAVLVKNTTPFTGGQDERHFLIVAKSDIDNTATRLKTILTQSVSGALRGQLRNGEALVPPTCIPTVSSDPRPGQEATQVHVTVSERCSAVAYDKDALLAKATALLVSQAMQQLGGGYSLLGIVHVSSIRATGNNALAFTCRGTWVYALADVIQARIKSLIAGKTKQAALHILLSSPGIERVSIAWADDTKLPKNIKNIHIVLLCGMNLTSCFGTR